MADLQLRQLRDKIVFVEESSNKLQIVCGLSEDQMKSLLVMAQGDELILLKMLLALYRRAKPLVVVQKDRKIKF